MVIDPTELLQFLLGPFGTLVLAFVIIITGYKGLWVFGWYAKELRDRNKRLEDKLDNANTATQKVTSIAEKVVDSGGNS